MVCDTESLLFSADMPRRLFEVSRVAIDGRLYGNVCGSIQCRKSPRINAQVYTLDQRLVLAAEAVSLESHYR